MSRVMLKNMLETASKLIAEVGTMQELEEIRVKFLGKEGLVSQQMKQLALLPAEEKKEFGQQINQAKVAITELVTNARTIMQHNEMQERIASEYLDMTLPSRVTTRSGGIHPVSRAVEEFTHIFLNRGFTIAEGPSIEDEWHNFTALNIAEDHPARQMHDTFYLKEMSETQSKMLLRTHTSPIQIRAMKANKPPYRFIAPGRTYRCDSDMTHTPMFHQIEGVWIDEEVNMGHLKYIVQEIIREFFERDDIEFMFRPSFFPFTEPSAEVDIRMNKAGRWLEVMGCGMVHPNVLETAGVDSTKYQGFAFGLGVERFAMLKYNIADLRQFFEGDARWLSHYNFSAFDVPSMIGGLSK